MIDPLLYLAAINAITFGLYWMDKRAAKIGGAARVPEASLLGVGFIGGTVAALFAQRMLRHKTRKASFQFKFWAITAVQIGLLLMPPPAVQALLSRVFS